MLTLAQFCTFCTYNPRKLTQTEDQASFIYSIEISSSALTQVTVSLATGFLAQRFSMKLIFIALQLCGILGATIYAFAGWPLNSAWAIVLARALGGMGGSSFGLILSYISTVATERVERASLIANYRAVTALATIPSSIMGLLLALPFLEFSIGSYELNAYTYPAWTSLLLQIVSMLLNIKYVRNVEKKATPATPSDSVQQTKQPKAKGIYVSIGVFLALTIFLFDGYFLSVLLYGMPIVMLDGYGWNIIQYAPINFLIAIVSLITIFSTKKFAKILGEYFYFIVVPGIGLMTIASALLCVGSVSSGKLPTGLGETLFVIGVQLCFVSFQLLQTSVSSIFGQIIPPEYIIRMMPLSSATFGLGKIVGPLLGELQSSIAGIPSIFYTLMVVSAIMLVVAIVFNKHLRNMDLVPAVSTIHKEDSKIDAT